MAKGYPRCGYYDADLPLQRQRRVESWATVNLQARYQFFSPAAEDEEQPLDAKCFSTDPGKEAKAIGGGSRWWSQCLAGMQIAIGVQNVADEDLPFVNLVEGYDTSAFTPIGRFYYVSIAKKF